jgi:hypothetical protein
MSDENLYEFLERRERELTHQIVGLKGQLARIQGELAQRIHELSKVRQMRGTVASKDDAASFGRCDALAASSPTDPLAPDYEKFTLGRLLSLARSPGPKPYAEMTIKELIIRALIDHFPNGSTTIEIRDFIQDAYGRNILPSSIRPQMHRLKADGVLGHEQSTDTWNFRDGKRELYNRYQSSWPSMQELEDNKDDG